MTLGLDRDKRLGHEQQLCEIQMYYLDRTRGLEVMVQTRCEQVDGQMHGWMDSRIDRQGDSYVAPNHCLRGV